MHFLHPCIRKWCASVCRPSKAGVARRKPVFCDNLSGNSWATVVEFGTANPKTERVCCLPQDWASGEPRHVGFSLAYLVVFVVALERYFYAPLVRRIMREHTYDVCLECGHWLKGLGDDIKRCPESGTAREALPPSASA